MNEDHRLVAFKRLLDIMDTLRQNCPWDKKQTLDSLRYLTIEETYELSDAIIDQNMEEIKKELGDLMLHMVFYAKIAEEQNTFNITDVLNSICEKLIHRHPHIYGDVKVSGAKEVEENWEKIKMKEGRKSVLSGVPRSLPAMIKAQRMQEKARGVGFDWDTKEQVWEKVIEELDEFKQAQEEQDSQEHITEEFGDLLFALINYARFIDINSEDALEKTNKKFIRRFTYVEEMALEENKTLKEMSLKEMDSLWDKAKANEAS